MSKNNSHQESHSRRNILQKTGVMSAGVLAVPNVASADTRNSSSEKNSSETSPTLKTFEGENVKVVSEEELPVSSENFQDTAGLTADSRTRNLPDCIGIPFTGVLEAQVCPRDDGSVSASVGALGVARDEVIIEPGEAEKTGTARAPTPIPGLRGQMHEIHHHWTARWDGTDIEYLNLNLTLKGWAFGEGWFEIRSVDKDIIN